MKRYIKIRVLGRGAYGLAWLAKDSLSDSPVVIKELPLETLSIVERERALREANLLSQLSHPNIVPYKGSFLEDGTLNIVTGYANLGDLQHYMVSPGTDFNGREEAFVVHIATETLKALAYLHDNNVIHRDVKPANIFLMQQGSSRASSNDKALKRKQPLSVMLGDFGIARVLGESPFATTLIGTPYYLSPELIARHPYSKKSDVWSLGVALYEIAAKKLPFTGKNIVAVAMQITGCQPAPLPAKYTQEFSAAVYKLLTKEESKRPSAREALALFNSLKPVIRPSSTHVRMRSDALNLRLTPIVLSGTYSDTLRKELSQRYKQLYMYARDVLGSEMLDNTLRQVLECVLLKPSVSQINFAISQHFKPGTDEAIAITNLVICVLHSWLHVGQTPCENIIVRNPKLIG